MRHELLNKDDERSGGTINEAVSWKTATGYEIEMKGIQYRGLIEIEAMNRKFIYGAVDLWNRTCVRVMTDHSLFPDHD